MISAIILILTPQAMTESENTADAIVVDRKLSFTCLYTHEQGALAERLFLESID